MGLGFRQDRNAAGSLQPNQYPSVSSMPAVRPEPQSLWDMMPQPEGNAQQSHQQNPVQFLDSQNMSTSLPAHSMPELHERRASLQAPVAGFENNERAGTTDCGGPRCRQTPRSTPRSAAEPTGSLAYSQHDMGPAPSSSSAAAVARGHRPRSSSSARSPSDALLREHGISLDQILSHIQSERRPSVSSAPSSRHPRATPQPQQQQQPRGAEYTHSADISPSRLSVQRDEDWDRTLALVGPPESHSDDYVETPARGVSKVVIIYFDEEESGRGPSRVTD